MEIKTVNRNRIYRMIYQNPRISRPELCHRLGLSMPTVMQNVRYLQDRGLVEEGGSLDSTGGRKAVALTCVKDARTAVGLDLTANHISGVLVDLEGGILAESREKRAFAVSGEYADALAGMVRDLIGKAAAPAERVLGVGVSMPGTFSADGGLMLDSRVLRMQNLRCAELSRSIPLPCVFCNDANAAGFAEVWDVQSPSDALYLSLSNTVGGAILLGGQLYKGENQRGGEFGHIRSNGTENAATAARRAAWTPIAPRRCSPIWRGAASRHFSGSCGRARRRRASPGRIIWTTSPPGWTSCGWRSTARSSSAATWARIWRTSWRSCAAGSPT